MSSSHYSDAAVTKLRTIIDAINMEIAHVPPSPTLRVEWQHLVELLALGPEPQTRVCPNCQGTGMRAASRCGHCWAALAPLPALVDGVKP